MPRATRTVKNPNTDKYVRLLQHSLKNEYGQEHPRARIDVLRRNNAVIWIRIVDADFHGQSIAEREEEVWKVLEKLPEDLLQELHVLLLLSPRELSRSLMSLEFDQPTPSML